MDWDTISRGIRETSDYNRWVTSNTTDSLPLSLRGGVVAIGDLEAAYRLYDSNAKVHEVRMDYVTFKRIMEVIDNLEQRNQQLAALADEQTSKAWDKLMSN